MKRMSIIIGLLLATMIAAGAGATTPQQACDQKSNEIGNKENQIKDVENQIKDIDNQITAKKQEIASLEDSKKTKKAEISTVSDENQKKNIENQVKDIENRIDSKKQDLKALEDRNLTKKAEISQSQADLQKSRAEVNQICNGATKCEQKKTPKEGLKEKQKEIEQSAAALRLSVTEKKEAVEKLQMKVVEEKASYDNLKCTNLVEGESSQEDIGRCNQIHVTAKADLKAAKEIKKEITQLDGEIKQLENKEKRTAAKVSVWYQSIAKLCQGDAVVNEALEMTKKDAGIKAIAADVVEAKNVVKVIEAVRISKPVIKKTSIK